MSYSEKNKGRCENQGDAFEPLFENECDCQKKENNCCRGIRKIKEGAGDVTLGLKDIEKAEHDVDVAIHEIEEALKALKRAKCDLDKAEKHDIEGLKDIREGICLIEEDLRKPKCFEPLCRG